MGVEIKDRELLAISIIFSFLGLVMLYHLAEVSYVKSGGSMKDSKKSAAYFEDFSEITKNYLEKEATVKGKIVEIKETGKGNFYGYIADKQGKRLRFFVLKGEKIKEECFEKGTEVIIQGRLTTFENEIEIFAESSDVSCG